MRRIFAVWLYWTPMVYSECWIFVHAGNPSVVSSCGAEAKLEFFTRDCGNIAASMNSVPSNDFPLKNMHAISSAPEVFMNTWGTFHYCWMSSFKISLNYLNSPVECFEYSWRNHIVISYIHATLLIRYKWLSKSFVTLNLFGCNGFFTQE